MLPTPLQTKLKRKINVLRVIGILLVIFQLMAYMGESAGPPEDSLEMIGYYFGYNMFMFIGLLLLLWSFNVGKKLKQVKRDEMMEGIGKNETYDI